MSEGNKKKKSKKENMKSALVRKNHRGLLHNGLLNLL